MSYRESNLDRNLRKWFSNDFSKSLLRSISLESGNIRGLSPFRIDFSYPITAIAGRNGSGKSTMLGLACCRNKGVRYIYYLPLATTTADYEALLPWNCGQVNSY